jgi:membrane protease YdiL (CAAX protease family)
MYNGSHQFAMENTSTNISRRVWGFWATTGLGIVVIIGVIFAIGGIDLIANEGFLVSVATCAAAVICIGLVIIFIKIRKRAPAAEYLGLRHITKKTILVLLAIALGLIILSDSLSFILGRPLNPQSMVNTYNTSIWPALLWVSIIIFAPAFEETLFRGFLFEGFRQSWLGVVGTIVLLSLVWSLLHLQYGAYEITTIFVLGLILGIVRFKTGSLWSTLLMHSFTNFIAMLEVAINVNAMVG